MRVTGGGGADAAFNKREALSSGHNRRHASMPQGMDIGQALKKFTG